MNARNHKGTFLVRCIAAITAWVIMMLALVPAYAQEGNSSKGGSLSFQQERIGCQENGEVVLPLVGTGEDIYGFEIRVEYPKDQLTFLGIQPANGQGWDACKDEDGVISYAYTQVGEDTGPLANHSVWASLRFLTKAQGTAAVKITAQKLITSDYQRYQSGEANVTCTLEISAAGSDPGGYTPPSSSSGTVTTTTKNPDGSTTTTTTDQKTGTTTETTKKPDGSKIVVETKKDGTVTTTQTDQAGNKTENVEKPDGSSVTKVEQKDGTTAVVNTDTEGKVEAEVTLPKQAVAAAQEGGTAIALPIPEVQAAASAEAAPVVTVKTGSDKPVKVLIPTAENKPSTVAVIVKEDGTEEIVKTSVSTGDGLAVALPDGATVKIVDNSKDFDDVASAHWADGAVSFVTARELFQGTGQRTFSPENTMTRAMLMTVLARFDGADTSGGSTWYEKGIEWATAKGISDGSNPNGNISREQLAVMLWRYAGSPAPTGGLEDFHDANAVSGYAQEAMRWAVEKGIVNGFGNGQLNPQGQATRAQVAQLLQNFIMKM